MSDKGIIFSAAMVQALLDGRKTQTRRLVTPQPISDAVAVQQVAKVVKTGRPAFNFLDCGGDPIYAIPTRHGYDGEYIAPYAPGDRLYVREDNNLHDENGALVRRHVADGVKLQWSNRSQAAWIEEYSRRHCPSIHMPRWASRLTLTVTDVRVQRLQMIMPPPPGADLVRWWADKLQSVGPMVEALIEVWPNWISRGELAARIGMSASGGSFGTYLSRLAGPGIIDRDRERGVRLSAEVMENNNGQ